MISRDEKTGKFVPSTDIEKLEKDVAEAQARLAAAKEQKKQEELAEAKKAEVVEAEQRKAAAADVQGLANAYAQVVKKNKEIRAAIAKEEREAYAKYRNALTEFAKRYKNYHLSYRYDGDNIEFKVEEARAASIEDNFNAYHKYMQDLMSWINDLKFDF